MSLGKLKHRGVKLPLRAHTAKWSEQDLNPDHTQKKMKKTVFKSVASGHNNNMFANVDSTFVFLLGVYYFGMTLRGYRYYDFPYILH